MPPPTFVRLPEVPAESLKPPLSVIPLLPLSIVTGPPRVIDRLEDHDA